MNTHIVIIDDNLFENDPLIFELGMKYGQDNIHLFRDPQEGLDYLLSHLEQRMAVLLDVQFPKPEKDGHVVLQELRNKTELIPVIIWSAKDGEHDNFTDFVKNHAFSFVKKGADTEEILSELEKAIQVTSTNVDVALEQWLENQDNKDGIMLVSKSGKSYTASQLIEEIRKQTDEGKYLVNSINRLTIDLLFRGKETL